MELKPYARNAKRHTNDQLAKIAASIRSFGFRQPIIADKDGTIIAGHGRYTAATEILGWKKTEPRAFSNKGDDTIPYVLAEDLTEQEVAAYRLADNKLNESDWDMDLVVEELKGLTDEMVDLSGFDRAIAIEAQELSLAPKADPAPKTRPGDVYALGGHLLMCGDSTKPEDVAALMGDRRAAMVFTDPPYNIAYEGGMGTDAQNKREMILNDKMSGPAFKEFLRKALSNMVAWCDGAIYVCMSSSEIVSLKEAFEEAGGHYQSFIIWAKNTFTLSRSDWQNQYEPILYGWAKGIVNHYFVGHRNVGNVWRDAPPDDEALLAWARRQIAEAHTDVWDENKPTKSTLHPTMKPLKLVARAIHASSVAGETVLDLFGGSGSTLVACEMTGRKCAMMELDAAYCDVIVDRYCETVGAYDVIKNGEKILWERKTPAT